MATLQRISEHLREPLVQFLALGALIFAVNAYVQPVIVTDNTVVVSASRIAAFRADFMARESRAPTQAQVQAFVDNYVDSEVLYRQAVALGLDRQDRLIRRQLVRKMRYLLEDASPLPEPTNAELQAWLDNHPQRYARPATVSFEHVFIDRAHADAKVRAAALLAALRSGEASAQESGDPFPAGTQVNAADADELAKTFGSDFGAALTGLVDRQWTGPIRSRLGLHLVRITTRTDAVAATIESAGKQLRVDYRSHRREQANLQAVGTLRSRYRVQVEDSAG